MASLRHLCSPLEDPGSGDMPGVTSRKGETTDVPVTYCVGDRTGWELERVSLPQGSQYFRNTMTSQDFRWASDYRKSRNMLQF